MTSTGGPIAPAQPAQQAVCPTCGRCPNCGQPYWQPQFYVPGQPLPTTGGWPYVPPNMHVSSGSITISARASEDFDPAPSEPLPEGAVQVGNSLLTAVAPEEAFLRDPHELG